MKRTSRFLLSFIISGIVLITPDPALAQLNPLGAVYYQNQYLANPAMAGYEKGLNMNLSYRAQWSGIQGAPVNQSFTADWGLEKVGVGLIIYNDQAGLLQQTRAMATYAYALPLGAEAQKLRFGLSLGIMSQRVRYEDIDGDPNDPNLEQFNSRENFVDGDFGIAYTSGRLNIQAAVPNMKVFLKKDENDNTVNRSTFYSAISYTLPLGDVLEGMSAEPKVAYRNVTGFDSMVDAGVNFSFSDNKLNLMTMWHSSKNMTYGIGINHKKRFSFTGMYSNNIGPLAGVVNGNFEMTVKVRVIR